MLGDLGRVHGLMGLGLRLQGNKGFSGVQGFRGFVSIYGFKI